VKDWITQLRKGLLEFCVLNVLAQEQTYGYRLVQQLRRIEELAIGESTAYPILARLRRDELLKVRHVPSGTGPPRRCYCLTDLGRRRVAAMNRYWDDLVASVERLRTPEKEEA